MQSEAIKEAIQRLLDNSDRHTKPNWVFHARKKMEEVLKIIDSLDARIDALMMEYCPDEMTPEQIERWGKHQKRCSPEEEAAIEKALKTSDRITEDFCLTFRTKADCVGSMASFIPIMLPLGVNPTDQRVKQIVEWCKENRLQDSQP